MSMLDRPISEFEGPVDSVRVPVVPPKGDCLPFQDVIVELATRLKLPRFMNLDGSRKFKDYKDLVINYETEPGSGIGFLAGWRGKGGEKFMRGEPNPNQWEMYAKNNCVYQHKLPRSFQYMRNWTPIRLTCIFIRRFCKNFDLLPRAGGQGANHPSIYANACDCILTHYRFIRNRWKRKPSTRKNIR